MVTTTFAAAALSVLVSTGSVSTIPSWQADYATALTAANAQQKPVAVFIGSGEAGLARLVSTGDMPSEAGRLLNAHYVCVYVDTDTTAGKALAGNFGLTSGLVISSRGGNLQALRHAGAVAPTDLTGYLTKFSDPTRTVTTTENGGAVPVSAVPAGGTVIVGGCANGRCPTATYAPSFGAPMYATSFPGYSFPGSSCPNGKCPR